MRGTGFVVIMLVLLAFFYVAQRTYVIEMGYQVEDLKSQKKKVEQMHNHLLIEVSTLASLERIERIATSILGMKRPESGQVVLLESIPSQATSQVVARTDATTLPRPVQAIQVAHVTFERQGTVTGSLFQRIKDSL